MRSRAISAALAAAAVLVSACAGGPSGDPGTISAPYAAAMPTNEPAEGAHAPDSGFCAESRKRGERCGIGEMAQHPLFWIALPLAAAAVITAPLWLPHVLLR